ncbi:MAG TPA: hypothetical protein VME66_14320 [Candidatus Acidoferrales bacterium]|nr:hypothetical protein [Candidatus Acidoferrales bacterium]
MYRRRSLERRASDGHRDHIAIIIADGHCDLGEQCDTERINAKPGPLVDSGVHVVTEPNVFGVVRWTHVQRDSDTDVHAATNFGAHAYSKPQPDADHETHVCADHRSDVVIGVFPSLEQRHRIQRRGAGQLQRCELYGGFLEPG